jgi:glutathione S-transferase
MSDLILHHYAGSPFAEKARLMLGFKGLPWTGVVVPTMLPKPDVVALTGGYRKTPFLQIGADVYCDTALIARVLEQRQPTPTLYPAGAPLAPLLAQWADSTLFWTVIPYTMRPAMAEHVFKGLPPEAVQAFAADRAAMTATFRRQTPVDAAAQLAVHLETLQAQLADGRRWLFGSEASIADFSVAHCLWFIRRAPPLLAILEPHRELGAWLERVVAIGHGRSESIPSAQAIAIAAGATTHAPVTVQPELGFRAGQPVTVAANDYGIDPVAGTLVGLDHHTVVVERQDERAGTVHVHFPRFGFQIKEQK